MVGFYIHVADAAIGLRRASKNKEMWTKKYCVFYCCRAGKERFIVRNFFNNTRTCEYFKKISYDVNVFCSSTASTKTQYFFVHISSFVEARLKPIAASAALIEKSTTLEYLPCLYTRGHGESWAIPLTFTTATFAVKTA